MGSLSRARSGRRSPATVRTCLAVVTCLAMSLMMQSSTTQAQQSGELVIYNGLSVNEDGRMQADVRIRGEKIVEIGPKVVAAPGAGEIDASGMLLLPGIVDTHTHLNLEPVVPPNPKGNADDLTSGSAAALAGGITTVSDFIRIENNEDPNAYADRVIGAIQKYSIADMFIHVSINPVSVPAGSPPDPLTPQNTLHLLAPRGFVRTREGFFGS